MTSWILSLRFIPRFSAILALILATVLSLPSSVAAAELSTVSRFSNFAQSSKLLVSASVSDSIKQAVDNPNRPDADRERDAQEKVAQILTFFGVTPGMQVADLMAGGGYYTELFSRVVGSEGQVYMQNEIVGWPWEKFFPPQIKARLDNHRLANVIRLDTPLEDMGLPESQLDLIFLSKFYHDSVWMGIDRQKMLQEIYTALKPGGILGIIDHQTEPGVGDRVVSSLHRIESEFLTQEVLAAGFILDGTSDLLSNSDDDHTLAVFDPGIRSHTDRFILRFRKPT